MVGNKSINVWLTKFIMNAIAINAQMHVFTSLPNETNVTASSL